MAALEDAAVDVTRQHRRDVAGDDGDHGFVESGDAVGDAAQANQCSALAMAGERGQTAIVVLRRRTRGVTEDAVARFGILVDSLNRHRYQQIAAHHAIAAGVVEDAASAGQPGLAGRDGAAVQESEGQPERGSRRAFIGTALYEPLMRASPGRFAFGVPREEIRRGCEPFEQVGLERRFTVGLEKEATNLSPGVATERGQTVLNLGGRGHPGLSVQSQCRPSLDNV